MATEKANANSPAGLNDQPASHQGDDKGPIALDDTSDSGHASDEERNTGGLSGVERIEATTRTWTKPWLIVTYIL
jgi:hypothetical protein